MPTTRFHTVCHKNVFIGDENSEATRLEGFSQGICFSATKVPVNEMVYIRITVASSVWHGALRLGFTSCDPSCMKADDLPRYLCPDLTNKPGYWARPLPQSYCVEGHVIGFMVNPQGEISVKLNNSATTELLIGGVNTSKPLWAAIDIYGNASTIEFSMDFGPRKSNKPPNNGKVPTSALSPGVDRIISTPVMLADTSPPVHYDGQFERLTFHSSIGKYVQLDSERTVATRTTGEYANGYVFSSRAIRHGETVVLKMLGFDRSYSGGLTVGVTACDPAKVTRNSMPDDADDLLDWPDYWVIKKNVYQRPEVGDELAFTVTAKGQLLYGKNGEHLQIVMHIDTIVPLFLFWDLFGQVCKAKVLGVIRIPLPRNLQPKPAKPVITSDVVAEFQELSVADLPDQTPKKPKEEKKECAICMDKPPCMIPVDCGHMCMCEGCAEVMHRDKHPCPICRGPIRNVVKVFSS